MQKRLGFLFFALIALLLLSPLASAQTRARDIADQCKLATETDAKRKSVMLREGYGSYWRGGTDGVLTVTAPRGKLVQGVMLSFFLDVPPIIVEAPDQNGVYQKIAEYREQFENAYIAFPSPESVFRIRTAEDSPFELNISRLRVLSEGELPDWVQRWKRLDTDAELLVISTHPDDELLWFGGLLPTYAGELHKKVMVAYMVGGRSGARKNELLDGLWTCGVRDYPDIGCLADGSQHPAWAFDGSAQRRVVMLLRKYRPQVVVTQDIEGEYGHPQHKYVVDAVIKAVTESCMDASFDEASAKEYGVYAPQKLYLHLWKERKIVMDWEQPLTAFDGKTGVQVAREAFKKHLSQQTGRYRITTGGKLDSRKFGLYYTTVGDDEQMNDLFEHCAAGSAP